MAKGNTERYGKEVAVNFIKLRTMFPETEIGEIYDAIIEFFIKAILTGKRLYIPNMGTFLHTTIDGKPEGVYWNVYKQEHEYREATKPYSQIKFKISPTLKSELKKVSYGCPFKYKSGEDDIE
jgi:nucleoid DNA-binding protein